MAEQANSERGGLVLDIDRFSTHDGPGIRMAVFTKGCPLACKWCHSPESQSRTPDLLYQQARCRACFLCVAACPNGAVSPRPDGLGIEVDRERCARCFACVRTCYTGALRVAGTMKTVAEIVEIARRDMAFYQASGGGVTVSGGEPLSHADFVLALMRSLKALGVHTVLETSGFGARDKLLAIAAHTDLLYFDIKLLDEARHRKWTGVSNAPILDNLRALAQDATIRERICVRTPCIPGVNDAVEDIRAIARHARSLGILRMEPLPYNGMADAKYEWLGVPYPLGATLEQDAAHFKQLEAVVAEEGLHP